MGVLGPDAVVQAPALTPPLHSLLATANEAKDPAGTRWENGFEFRPDWCDEGGLWVPCLRNVNPGLGLGGDGGSGFVEQAKDGHPPEDVITFVPYVIWADKEDCGVHHATTDFAGIVTRKLDLIQHKQIEHEFWTGEQMAQATYENGLPVENMSLVTSTPADGVLNPGGAAAPVAVTALSALSLLTQALSNCNGGGRGMIHATPYLAELWSNQWSLKEVGGKLMTNTKGNLVVSGGGYPGTGPAVVTQPLTLDQVWVYATSMVEYRLSEVEIIPGRDAIAQAMNRRTNTITVRAERFAAAVWDGCCTFAVLVDLCAGGC